MNFLKGVISLVLLASLWAGSTAVKTIRLNGLVDHGKIPYGPLPDKDNDYYSFDGLHAAFDPGLEIKRADEYSKKEFEQLILSSIDDESKENLKKYLTSTLNFSEEYQMDPFWILSVMMVESRFDKTAQSPMNARGLMQIKPDTAGHLYQLMNKRLTEEEIKRNLHHPKENIEVGVFYLKKLLQNFRLNYHHATIAYNLGPNKLKSRLDYNDIDIVNYSYLVKVQDHYNVLSKNFSESLKKRPRPFEYTYVIKDQGKKLEDKILDLFIVAQNTKKSDIMLTSENLVEFLSKSRTF